jgi:hypothetical protein
MASRNLHLALRDQHSHATQILDVPASVTVALLKSNIRGRFPDAAGVEAVNLVYDGQLLQDHLTLQEVGLTGGGADGGACMCRGYICS